MKRQTLSLLQTVCTDIRTQVALRTLSTILDAGKKRSRPAVILMQRSSLGARSLGLQDLGLSITAPVVLKRCANLHMVVR